jgi:oligopeptide transport system substrate-binding protein
MQFVADQWKKNLRIEVSLEALENSYFQSQVQKSALGLYRRGFSLERPTCLAALEVFHSEHKQNHIGFQSPEFDHHIRQMKLLKIEDVEYHDHCRLAVEELLLKGYMIPTGPIYFSMLIRPNWKGWKLNSLNHLDLESLRFEN